MENLIKEMVKKEVEKVFAAGGQATFSSTRTNHHQATDSRPSPASATAASPAGLARNIDQPQMHNLTPSSSRRTQLVLTISRARGKVTLFLEIINKPLGGVGEEVDIILVIVLHQVNRVTILTEKKRTTG